MRVVVHLQEGELHAIEAACAVDLVDGQLHAVRHVDTGGGLLSGHRPFDGDHARLRSRLRHRGAGRRPGETDERRGDAQPAERGSRLTASNVPSHEPRPSFPPSRTDRDLFSRHDRANETVAPVITSRRAHAVMVCNVVNPHELLKRTGLPAAAEAIRFRPTMVTPTTAKNPALSFAPGV